MNIYCILQQQLHRCATGVLLALELVSYSAPIESSFMINQDVYHDLFACS